MECRNHSTPVSFQFKGKILLPGTRSFLPIKIGIATSQGSLLLPTDAPCGFNDQDYSFKFQV